MAKKRFRIKDSQGNVVPYDVGAEDVTMADGRSVEAGKASLKAVAGFLDPAHFPIVMLYNVAPFTSTPDYSSIPVGIVYLDESLTAPYKRLYYKKSVEGTAQSIDLGAPKDGVIYFHQSTGKLYRWVATSQGNDGSFTQIGILGINDIPGLADAIAAAGSGAVTVTTNQDGTFTIHVGDNDYTVNLNHTHEHMAKLVICEESDLPSTLDMDTIYAQVDDAETPREIQSLWIAGLEFVGGGGAPGTPRLTSPTTTQIENGIDIGDTTNDSVSYSLKIKANKYLTQPLLAEWGNGSTGYSFDTLNLPTGVTYDSGTGKLTITAEAAKSINGVDIPVVYTGSDNDINAEGTLGISSSSVDGIQEEVQLFANKLKPITAVKFTRQQGINTGITPGANSKFQIDMQFDGTFTPNTSMDTTVQTPYFIASVMASSQEFNFNYQVTDSYNQTIGMFCWLGNCTGVNAATVTINTSSDDRSVLDITCGGQNKSVSFQNQTVTPPGLTTTLGGPLRFGCNASESKTFAAKDIILYGIKHYESDILIHDFKPVQKRGVAGLYDELTDTFISSITSTELEAIL